MIEVNYMGILAAGIVSMAIGFFWYSPVFLGNIWIKEKGFTKESMKKAQKEMGKWYGISSVLSLLTAFVLSHVMTMSQAYFHYPILQTGLSTAF